KFYSTVGIHPLYTELQDIDSLYTLGINDKVVAIGEIGLDSTKDNFDEQKMYLIKQIIIANELHLPVIIHSNNTNKLVIEIFEKYVKPKYGCVFHCFQPDIDDLNYLIMNGYYISFAGRITYKTAIKSIEVAAIVPNELFLVETDSPYISPEPFRGEINRTSNIDYIINRIAKVKGMSFKDVESITVQNTKRLFKKIK
ncbi:MAG: TatD family hydrolase, partial [Bacilli bacterium]